MAEDGDFSPGAWGGESFADAGRAYDRTAARSYDDAKAKGKTAKDCIPKSISTQSKRPIIVVCDMTGSMAGWPRIIFSKLGYLDIEGDEYFPEGKELSFWSITDANNDDEYPLQVTGFAKGPPVKKNLESIIPAGGGGGGLQETYEIAAYYAVNNVEMPNAVNPIIIFIGDESFYPKIKASVLKKLLGTAPQSDVDSYELWKKLKQKFSVYHIHKPYGGGEDAEILKEWRKVLGDDYICDLPQPERVVDVIFGIFAKETGRIEYFEEELKGRQKPAQVKTVLEAVRTIHALPASRGKHSGHSIMLPPSKSAGGSSGSTKTDSSKTVTGGKSRRLL